MQDFISNYIKRILRNRRLIIIICICILVIIFLSIKMYDKYLSTNKENEIFLDIDNEIISNTEDENIEDKNEEEKNNELENLKTEKETEVLNENNNSNNICIYVTGEVNNAGVYYLKEGSRIIDAINSAGGITDKANISKINLAFILEDGMKITIPNDNDLKNKPDFNFVTKSSGDGESDINKNPKNESANLETNNRMEVININTASQTELETLPGIGPSLALKIIEYRKLNGDFKSIEDIKNVSGIGDSKFKDIKNYIKVK